MAVDIPFRRKFAFEYAKVEQLSPGIRRVVANNPNPFTFHGTGTYILGTGNVAVIDPGPDSFEHIDAILKGLGDEKVSHILVTHTHMDHSPGCRLLNAIKTSEDTASGCLYGRCANSRIVSLAPAATQGHPLFNIRANC